jgi:hypothetical protein
VGLQPLDWSLTCRSKDEYRVIDIECNTSKPLDPFLASQYSALPLSTIVFLYPSPNPTSPLHQKNNSTMPSLPTLLSILTFLSLTISHPTTDPCSTSMGIPGGCKSSPQHHHPSQLIHTPNSLHVPRLRLDLRKRLLHLGPTLAYLILLHLPRRPAQSSLQYRP